MLYLETLQGRPDVGGLTADQVEEFWKGEIADRQYKKGCGPELAVLESALGQTVR